MTVADRSKALALAALAAGLIAAAPAAARDGGGQWTARRFTDPATAGEVTGAYFNSSIGALAATCETQGSRAKVRVVTRLPYRLGPSNDLGRNGVYKAADGQEHWNTWLYGESTARPAADYVSERIVKAASTPGEMVFFLDGQQDRYILSIGVTPEAAGMLAQVAQACRLP